MPEQHKRGSLPDHGEHVQSSSKKPRAQALIKQERLEGGRRGEELEEGEVGQGGAAGAMVAAIEVMDAPQLNLRMGLALFHCRACLLPSNLPHSSARPGTSCAAPAGLTTARRAAAPAPPTPPAPRWTRSCATPSCRAHSRSTGARATSSTTRPATTSAPCPWAPCHCPDPGCDAFTSPARLVEHFRAVHPSWPVTDLTYKKPCRIAVPPPPHGLHVLVAGDDRSLFLVTSSALGPATLVSVVCARANGDAAAGAAQFKCQLWAEGPPGAGNAASLTFVVASSDLSGGVAAAEQGDFLAVTPKMVRDVSGEALGLKVRIDRMDRAAATSSPTSSEYISRFPKNFRILNLINYK
ncbi:unnamed protein product [Urochloa humidicola]